jgi:hypothetical protein
VDVHLAQINVGRLLAPIDAPETAAFAEALDPVNALADASPGFVWRLQTDAGNATAVRAFEDDTILVNMSVWESPDALNDFVYRSQHTPFLQRRREWFEKPAEAIAALWWVRAGEIPTVAEGVARLEHLRAHGPTAVAFTFHQVFPPAPATIGNG